MSYYGSANEVSAAGFHKFTGISRFSVLEKKIFGVDVESATREDLYSLYWIFVDSQEITHIDQATVIIGIDRSYKLFQPFRSL